MRRGLFTITAWVLAFAIGWATLVRLARSAFALVG